MSSHPDISLVLRSLDTETKIITEVCFHPFSVLIQMLNICQVKRKKHGLPPEQILGQEVSEMLATMLINRSIWKQKEYTVSSLKWSAQRLTGLSGVSHLMALPRMLCELHARYRAMDVPTRGPLRQIAILPAS